MAQFIWVDYLLIGLVVISTLLSLMRGFVREALSLVSWAVAFYVATRFSYRLAGYFESWLAAPSARLALGFAVLFAMVLFLGALVTKLVCQVVNATGLTGTDRTLGMVFGFARGLVVVAVLVMMAGLTPLPQDPWWDQSILLPHVQPLIEWVQSVLPESISSYFVYS